MTEDYILETARGPEDEERLADLYREVFHPEKVDVLARTFFRHLPGMVPEDWFVAREPGSTRIAAAMALIPWTWQMGKTRLKVAEMGLVGTRPAHRGKNLMRRLMDRFVDRLAAQAYDLAAIQGIPGFYHRFGYHFAVAMENHVHLHLDRIADPVAGDSPRVRMADLQDIPFLMRMDGIYRNAHLLSSVRQEEEWRYLLGESRGTEYGSDFWILSGEKGDTEGYCRISKEGFGAGLIVSEASESLPEEALLLLLRLLKQEALERGKPYLRFNLHPDTDLVRMAVAMGAGVARPYAWQVKVPDHLRLLRQMGPLLEERLAGSCFHNCSTALRLDFFTTAVDLVWQQGRLAAIREASGERCARTFCIPSDLFPLLCLGHRTWQELQHTRPDIFPANQYVQPDVPQDTTALLVSTLFPRERSWIRCRY
jgi:predicted N-acetyltransferase YhbS